MKITSIALVIIGLLLLVVSLLADVIGIGEYAGFGPQQTASVIVGIVVAAVGLLLMLRRKRTDRQT